MSQVPDPTFIMVGDAAERRRCYACGALTLGCLQFGDASSAIALSLCEPHIAILVKHCTDYLADVGMLGAT